MGSTLKKLSGYSAAVLNTPSAHQGGIALFWRPKKSYKVEDWRIFGPNELTFMLVTGSQRFLLWGVTFHQTI